MIAALSSLISFRLDLPFHLKLFSGLLVLTFLVEVTSFILVYVLREKNSWLYNGFVLVEFWVYGYYYYRVIHAVRLRRIIFLFLAIFPILWAVTTFFHFGFFSWNAYVIITGSFFTVVFSIMYYYQIITAREIVPLRQLSEFWIATGMLIFYLISLPYFGILSYLLKHMEIARALLKVFKIMDMLMYALISYGFLCRITNTKEIVATRKSS